MKILSYTLTFLFVVFAALQYNDVDPLIWISIYLAVAALSASAYLRPLPAWAYGAAALLFLAGTAYMWPDRFEGVGSKMQADQPWIEEAREALGLLVCGLSMTTFAVLVRLRARRLAA